MLNQLIEETKFKIQEGTENPITNLNNDITNTYAITNLSSNQFISGRLKIKPNHNEYLYLSNSNSSYSIVNILSDNIFDIHFFLDNNTTNNPIILSTSHFIYKNNKNKINNIKISANPYYEISLFYLLIDSYHNTFIDSLLSSAS